MACRIHNPYQSPVTLPFPLRGILAPGQGVVVSAAKAAVEAALGPSALRISEVPESRSLGEVNDSYLGWLSEFEQTIPLLPTALSRRIYDPRTRDIVGMVEQAAAAGALTLDPVQDTNNSLYWFRHDQQDTLSMRYQFDHSWGDTAINPHLHLMSGSPSAGDAVFVGEYAWTRVGSGLVLPALSGWTAFRKVASFTIADRWQEKLVNLATITPPDLAKGASATLWIRVTRDGSDPADTLEGAKGNGTNQANLGLVFFDCHFDSTSFGTVPV